MKHFVNRGHTIQLNWTLHSISGQEFALTGHTYKLFFATGNQSAQATGVTHSGNVLSWTFTPNAQWKLGSYTIWLEVYNNGTKIITVAYPDAFHLVHEVAASGTTQTGSQTSSTTLNLVSSCDFYRFAPVVPVAGDDGYWYVNGAKAVDGNGEYILTSHTLEYDEQTRNLIIDRGRVDSEGNSIEQVITALADLDSLYHAAEGSADGSVAGDGSRWGSYKTAENARNTAAQNAETARQTAASAAEGSSSGSVAGDGSRWGTFKSGEAARQTAAENAEGSKNGSVAGDGTRWGQFKQAEAARDASAQEEASAASQAAEAANAAASRANTAAALAEHMIDIHRGPAGVAPVIGNNGNWWVWNDESEDYVDTELPARGTDGVGFESAETPAIPDGTFIITLSNGDKMAIDLNHNHPNYFDKLVGSSIPSGGLVPDTAYKLGTLTGAVTITLASAVSGCLNHYYFTFDTSSTAPTITFPVSVTKWDGNCVTSNAPVISASKHYEVSILDGVGFIYES
jgi:hypothetical protein